MAIESMLGSFAIKIDGREIEAVAERLGSAANRTDDVMRRAINRAGDQAFTIVKREVARQMGIRVGVAADQMRRRRADYGSLTYSITASGQFMSMRDFGARRTKKGVSAQPWAVRRIFPDSFFVATLGGHVFHRVGPKVKIEVGKYKGQRKQLIKKMWGPALPNEVVRGTTREAFERVVATVLPQRVEHEIGRILGVAMKG